MKERCNWCGEEHNSLLIKIWHKFQLWKYHFGIDFDYGIGTAEAIDKSNKEYCMAEALLQGFDKQSLQERGKA